MKKRLKSPRRSPSFWLKLDKGSLASRLARIKRNAGPPRLHELETHPNSGDLVSTTRSRDGETGIFIGYEVEKAAYEERKRELLREAPGEHVVFVGEEMLGPFPDLPTALKAGYQKFGYVRLYIKQLIEEASATTGATDVSCRS